MRSGPNEKRLLHEIFKVREYNKLERPVEHDSDALNVTLGITLQQIIDVVSK